VMLAVRSYEKAGDAQHFSDEGQEGHSNGNN